MELKIARNDSSKASHQQNEDGTVTIRERVITDYGEEEEQIRVVTKEDYAAMHQL